MQKDKNIFLKSLKKQILIFSVYKLQLDWRIL